MLAPQDSIFTNREGLFGFDDDALDSQGRGLHTGGHVNRDGLVHDHRAGVVGEGNFDLAGFSRLEWLSGPLRRCAPARNHHITNEYRNVGLVLVLECAGLRPAGFGERSEVVYGLEERQFLVFWFRR